MKITQLATVSLLLACFLWMSNLTGALPGNTGAPNEFTCGRAPCHNIPANAGDAQIAIRVNDSTTTYRPGEVLTITVSIEGAQSARNGFQILALDESNNNLGQWILTAPELMKIIDAFSSPRKYVTHQAAGNQQSNWSMNWQAPDEDVGKVTFYASVLDANDNGFNTGDSLYTTTNTLTPEVASAVEEQREPLAFELFPNPATGAFRISLSTKQPFSAILYHSNGKKARRWARVPDNQQLDIEELPQGIYFLELLTEKGRGIKKLLIQRSY